MTEETPKDIQEKAWEYTNLFNRTNEQKFIMVDAYIAGAMAERVKSNIEIAQLTSALEAEKFAHELTKNEKKDERVGGWQLCPKCLGQGIVGFPPVAVAGSTPTSTGAVFQCDVCNGNKILPTPPKD